MEIPKSCQLITGFFRQRLSGGSFGATAKELLQSNPYTLPERLVQAIIDNDEQLREWIVSLVIAALSRMKSAHGVVLSVYVQAIKQVLENVNPLRPPTASASTFRSSYLPDTAKEIERLHRLHGTAETIFAYHTTTGTGVALSLDLDSNLREKGVRGAGQWAGTDASRKDNALSAIFDALRRGRLDDAEEVCSKSGEAWRLATIRGARFWGCGKRYSPVDDMGSRAQDSTRK